MTTNYEFDGKPLPDTWEGIAERILGRGANALSGYYIGFEPTGDPDIDLILGAVALAGKGAHHTRDWQDPSDYYHAADGVEFDACDVIQQMAFRAAERRKADA